METRLKKKKGRWQYKQHIANKIGHAKTSETRCPWCAASRDGGEIERGRIFWDGCDKADFIRRLL
jgi:hypothetical protein